MRLHIAISHAVPIRPVRVTQLLGQPIAVAALVLPFFPETLGTSPKQPFLPIFIWKDFFSEYLEMVKPEYKEGKQLPIDRATYEQTVNFFEQLTKKPIKPKSNDNFFLPSLVS